MLGWNGDGAIESESGSSVKRADKTLMVNP
jgi:hypothetical protein